MIGVKADCFAFEATKAGKHRCNALNEMRCEGCPFYKTDPTGPPTVIYRGMILDKLAEVRAPKEVPV